MPPTNKAFITRIVAEPISASRIVNGQPTRLMVAYLYYIDRGGKPFCFMSVTRHLHWNGKQFVGATNIVLPGRKTGLLYKDLPTKQSHLAHEIIFEREQQLAAA